MRKSSAAVNERSAAIACRRAGLAMRLPPIEAAYRLLDLALAIANCCGDARAVDKFTDDAEDQLRRLQRLRRRGLWTELVLEQELREQRETLERAA